MAEKGKQKTTADLFSRLHNFICNIPRLVTLQVMPVIHTHAQGHSRQVLVSESTRANPEGGGGQIVQTPPPENTRSIGSRRYMYWTPPPTHTQLEKVGPPLRS